MFRLVVSAVLLFTPLGAGAQLLVGPGIPVDVAPDGYAEGDQSPVLVAEGEPSLLLFADGRDQSVRIVRLDGDLAGASRRSVRLPGLTTLENTALGWSAGGALVAWTDDAGVHAQRLELHSEAQPQPLGDPILVTAGADFHDPRVAYGANEWMIAYRQGTAIRGRFLGTGDAMSNELTLVDTGTWYQLLSVDGRYALMTNADDRLVVTPLSSQGLPLDSLLLAPVPPDTLVAAVADARGGWVAWHTAGGQLFGRRFDPVFEPVGFDVPLTGIGSRVESVELASNGTRTSTLWSQDGALLAADWLDDGLGTPHEVGSTAGVSDVVLVGRPQIALLDAVEGGGHDLIARPIGDGESERITAGTGPRTDLSLVWTGADFAATWAQPFRTDSLRSSVRTVGGDAVPTGAPVALGSDAGQSQVTTAVTSGRLWTAWVQADHSVVVEAFDSSQAPLASSTLGPAIVVAEENPITALDVVPLGDQAQVIWATSEGVWQRAIDATGQLVGDDPSVLSNEGATVLSGQALDTGTLVMWSDGSSITAMPVDGAGAPGDAFTVIEFPALALDSAAHGDSVLLFAAVDLTAVTSLTLYELSPGGVVDTLSVSAAIGADQLEIASDGASAWLVWAEGEQLEVSQFDGALGEPSTLDLPLLPGSSFAVASQAPGTLGLLVTEPGRTSLNDDVRLTFRQMVPEDGGLLADAGGPYLAVEGTPITLDGSGSLPSSGIDQFDWLVDGEAAGSGQLFEYTFTDTGELPVELVVRDLESGSSDSDRVFVHVANVPSALALAVVRPPYFEGIDVGLSATVDDPGGLDDITLRWRFGDGHEAIGTVDDLAATTHAFAEGEWTVCVAALEAGAPPVESCETITVQNATPIVSFDQETLEVDEGSVFEIGFSVVDPGDDPVTVFVSYGNGHTAEYEGSWPSTLAHKYVDDRPPIGPRSPYNLCIRATDDSEDFSTQCLAVIVNNVAPTIVGEPVTEAVEGLDDFGHPVFYSTTLTIVDPGHDEIAAVLEPGGMPGVRTDLNEAGTQVTVWFQPTLTLWSSRLDPTWTFRLLVSDGEASPPTELVWDITITLTDEDEDGLPDSCETLYSLAPDDTAEGDADDDGVNNRQECLGGTDPTVSDLPPSAPILDQPADGSVVSRLDVELSVQNIVREGGGGYSYTFEIYDGPNLLPAQLVRLDNVVESTADTTGWRVPGLVDGAHYYWRARAHSGLFSGPWMDVAEFTVVLPNAEPSAPTAIAPEGLSATTETTFTWTNADDADNDGLTYSIEIYHDADLTSLDRHLTDLPEGADPWSSHTVSEADALADNALFFWRVRAVDERGAVGPWSNVLAFEHNTGNDVPGTPILIAPDRGSQISTRFPELVVTAVEDPDGDALTYDFVVARTEMFDLIVSRGSDVLEGDDGLVRHTVNRQLDENTAYHWRAAARDRHGRLGGFVQGDFTINEENDPPLAPTFQFPADDAVLTDPNLTLVVRNTVDPDGDLMTYEFELTDDSGFSDPLFAVANVTEGGGDETSVTVDLVLAFDTEYAARARAEDSVGEVGPWSDVVHFTVVESTVLPVAPTLVLPANESVLQTGTVEFAVMPLGDTPEGLTYTFEISPDPAFEEQVTVISDVPENGDALVIARVDDPLAEGTYYWRARAELDADRSPWSGSWSFSVSFGPAADAVAEAVDAGTDLALTDLADPGPTPSDTGCCATINTPDRGAWLWFLAVIWAASRRRRGGFGRGPRG